MTTAGMSWTTLSPCPRRYHVLEKMTAHKAGGAAEMEEVLGILMSLKPDVLKFGVWRGRFHAPFPSFPARRMELSSCGCLASQA